MVDVRRIVSHSAFWLLLVGLIIIIVANIELMCNKKRSLTAKMPEKSMVLDPKGFGVSRPVFVWANEDDVPEVLEDGYRMVKLSEPLGSKINNGFYNLWCKVKEVGGSKSKVDSMYSVVSEISKIPQTVNPLTSGDKCLGVMLVHEDDKVEAFVSGGRIHVIKK